MSATSLCLWGIVIHLVVDWLGQNEWMAVNKMKRRKRLGGHGSLADPSPGDAPWWDRHPAAYVHAGMHGVAQLLVFPWWAALAIGVTHLLIDTRIPVAWWSRTIRQTQPSGDAAVTWHEPKPLPVMDIGADVRIWADQVWHIGVVALLALVVG